MKMCISGMKNYISLARTLAAIMIFVCHIFQYYGSFLAFHFNTGVYVFLIISGILFSQNDLHSTVNFYIKRAKRILLPYYLFILFIIIINILQNNSINILSVMVNIFCLQWFFDGIDKTGHLWYISAYIICCLTTPFLYKICLKFKDRGTWYFLILLLFEITILIIGRIISKNLFPLCTYILSYFIGFKFSRNIIEYKSHLKVLMFFGFFMEFVILLKDIWGNDTTIISSAYIIEPIKILFSISMLLMCYFLGNRLTKINAVFKWFDKYSYSVYLTHHVWILGTLSVLNLTKSKILNIFTAIILTIVFTVILQNISDYIINKCKK